MNNLLQLRPTKTDIKQIEALVKLGVRKSDIAAILQMTETKLGHWERKNPVIEELLRVKPRPEHTLTYADFADRVEEVFACAGKRYYRFKDEFRMPAGRYKYYHSILKEFELKVNLETLGKFVQAFKAVLNGGGKKKSIEITDLFKLVLNMESRLELAFDVGTIRRAAAVAYFDETEDLTTFDPKYGDEKIKIWLEHNHTDFFLTRRIGELLNVNDISVESLEEHLNLMNGIIQDLNLNLQTVLEENS